MTALVPLARGIQLRSLSPADGRRDVLVLSGQGQALEDREQRLAVVCAELRERSVLHGADVALGRGSAPFAGFGDADVAGAAVGGVGLTLDQLFALKTVEQRDQARLVIADAPGELELRLDGSSSQVGEDDVLPHREAVAFEQRSLGVAEAPRDAGEHRGKVVALGVRHD